MNRHHRRHRRAAEQITKCLLFPPMVLPLLPLMRRNYNPTEEDKEKPWTTKNEKKARSTKEQFLFTRKVHLCDSFLVIIGCAVKSI